MSTLVYIGVFFTHRLVHKFFIYTFIIFIECPIYIWDLKNPSLKTASYVFFFFFFEVDSQLPTFLRHVFPTSCINVIFTSS